MLSWLGLAGCGEITGDDLFEMSFCNCAKTMAATLCRHEALLLPEVYRQFSELVLSAGESSAEIPSMRWFVSRIYHYFGNNIVLECKHRRFGTILYHKDCHCKKCGTRS